jgi:hypothetical protein
LVDLADEFSDGRIQFAFVKVKDPNTSLPKNVLIAWVSLVETAKLATANHSTSAARESQSEQKAISVAT